MKTTQQSVQRFTYTQLASEFPGEIAYLEANYQPSDDDDTYTRWDGPDGQIEFWPESRTHVITINPQAEPSLIIDGDQIDALAATRFSGQEIDRRTQADERTLEAYFGPQGIDYFWSRFGGWKMGRKDRDDDVSRGYSANALIMWHEETKSLSDYFGSQGKELDTEGNA